MIMFSIALTIDQERIINASPTMVQMRCFFAESIPSESAPDLAKVSPAKVIITTANGAAK